MENITKICCNVAITINNKKHNILDFINQTEKNITVNTKCYSFNSTFDLGQEHEIFHINIGDERKKGKHLPVFLEQKLFQKQNIRYLY